MFLVGVWCILSSYFAFFLLTLYSWKGFWAVCKKTLFTVNYGDRFMLAAGNENMMHEIRKSRWEYVPTKKKRQVIFSSNLYKKQILTLHVEHHAVWDPFASVRHDTRQLLFVGLTARHHHVIAPYRHRPVLVASLLERGFALQPGVPLDHTRRLPVGWHTSGDSHLAFAGPGHNCGRCQSHACHRPSCAEDRIKQTNYIQCN